MTKSNWLASIGSLVLNAARTQPPSSVREVGELANREGGGRS